MTIDEVLEHLTYLPTATGLVSESVLHQIYSVRGFLRQLKETFNLSEDPVECVFVECPSREPAGIFKVWLKTKKRLLSLSTNGPGENDLRVLHLVAIRLARITRVEVVQRVDMDATGIVLHLVDGEELRIAAGVIRAGNVSRDLRDMAVALQRAE